MTYLTERQAMRLAERLRDLPRLASATVTNGPGGSTVAAPAPPGVNLAAVDAGREQPRLLAKLGECIRTICEEMPADIYRKSIDTHPLRPEGQGTWATETGWLLATMGWWQGDDWCAEWVASEVKVIRYALIELVEEATHHRTCGECGHPVEAYRNKGSDYALAECPNCHRVLGMADVGYRERVHSAWQMLASRITDLTEPRKVG